MSSVPADVPMPANEPLTAPEPSPLSTGPLTTAGLSTDEHTEADVLAMVFGEDYEDTDSKSEEKDGLFSLNELSEMVPSQPLPTAQPVLEHVSQPQSSLYMLQPVIAESGSNLNEMAAPSLQVGSSKADCRKRRRAVSPNTVVPHA